MIVLIFFISSVWATSDNVMDRYCRAQSSFICVDLTKEELCKLSITQCKLTWNIAQNEQKMAHAEGRDPEVIAAELVKPDICKDGVCEKISASGSNCKKTESEVVPLKKTSKWAPVFTVQSVIRVQTGSKVDVKVVDSQSLDISSNLSSYMAKRKISIDKALSASDSDFKKFINTTEENFTVLNTIRKLMGMPLKSAEGYLRAISGKLSFDQKAQILSSVLNLWNSRYDTNRSDNINGAQLGVVGYEDMMKNAKSVLGGKDGLSGVCRDMHTEASKLAKAMGITHAYGVGFNTKNSGHQTLIIQNPNDRTQIYKLNYGVVAKDEGCSGANCLEQRGWTPSNGINLNTWSSNDELMFVMPTEIGSSLHRASGGNASELFPLYEYQDSFLESKIKTGPINIGVFYSNHSNSDRSVEGASLSLDQIGFGPVTVGAGAAAYLSHAGEYKTQGGYLRANGEIATPTLKLNENKFSAIAGGSTRIAVYTSENPAENMQSDKISKNSVLNLYAGIKAENKNAKGSITVSSVLDGSSHARDAYAGPGFTRPVISMTYDNRFKITKNIDGSFQVLGSVVSLDTGIHPNIKVKGGISNKYFDASLSVGRSIRKDTPLYIPGAGTSAVASVQVKVVNGVMVGASIGVNECAGVGACFFGTGGLTVVH